MSSSLFLDKVFNSSYYPRTLIIDDNLGYSPS